ncbi:Reverse transcriptase [Phytophthora palmivora]|uniref:Reverse transcriptase n=1 Tax=Phytophthora palmivora TaxID=4796 RepID=A0A2P4YRM9_9STRA|nr:Reverse transcriptase [Phytophthora palmivora]
MDRGEFPHLTDAQFASVRKMVERFEKFDTYERGLIAHVQGLQTPVAEMKPTQPKPLRLKVNPYEGKKGENIHFWVREVELAMDAALISTERLWVAFSLSNLGGNPLPEHIKVTVFMDGLKVVPSRTQLLRIHANPFEKTVQIALQEGDQVSVRLADGGVNVPGVRMDLAVKFEDFDSTESFLVLDMDKYDLILGMPGLEKHDPWMDWRGKAIGASRPAVSDRVLVSNVPTSVRDWGARDGRQGAYAPEEVMGVADSNEGVAIAKMVLLKPETSPKDLNSSSVMDEDVLEGFTKQRATRLGSEILKNPEDPVYPLVKEYSDVVSKHPPSQLPPDRGVRHEIDLVPGTKYCAKSGMVRESKSPHSTPTFCVRKPNGKWRLVHAYNKLNNATVPAQTPIHRKDVLLNSMSGCTLYSALDLVDGYYQILMRESDIPLTAVSTRMGCFGSGYRAEDGQTAMEVHLKHLRRVFEVMRANKLYANIDKCVFAAEEI